MILAFRLRAAPRPKAGLVYSEMLGRNESAFISSGGLRRMTRRGLVTRKGNLSEVLCKPKIMPIKLLA